MRFQIAALPRRLCLGCALLLSLGPYARAQTTAPGLDPGKPISQYVRDAWTIDEGLPQSSVMAIAQGRDGYLWLGTEAGLVRFDGVTFTTYNTANSSGLRDNFINSLLVDRENTVWGATWIGGVFRVIRGKPATAAGSGGSRVNYLYQDRAGTIWGDAYDAYNDLWIGTGKGLDLLRDGRLTTQIVTGYSIYGTIQTSDGTLWLATSAGLAQLRHGRLEALASPFPTAHVSAFLEDRTGALWIGGYSGLFRWKDGRLHDYTGEGGIAHAGVATIVEDSEGSLWIGTHGQGLLRLQDGRFTTFTRKDGLSSDVVESLYLDEHGVWLGTQGGLHLLHEGRIRSLPLAGSALMKDIYQILKDDNGSLWLSSNEGLARVSQEELLAAVAGRRDSVEVHQIVPLDGRRRIEFNGASQNAGWKDADGRLWFPSIKGLVTVDPAHLANNPLPPPVHIESLLVDGKPVELGEDLHLRPGRGGLELHYTATSLLIPERVTFRYRLEGYDKDWVDAGTRRVAYYTHVPGGQYRFQVFAANNDGVWNQSGAVLSFRLRPHFYEMWWFYVLCGVALLAAILGTFRFRVRRIQQHARDLAALVEDRTGELQREVTERRHAEERYRHLFDANPQPVWVSDRESLAFLAVNDAAARHYGYSREEFAAMHLSDLQPSEQGAALSEWIRAAGDGWRGTSTWQHQKKDGSVIEVEVAAQAFTFAGRPAALIVAADVTARRDLEERLRNAQKMEAVGQLAGGIAHDLNNILTAVMAHVDLAVSALPADAALLGDLTQAQAAAHRGAGMIRKLLGFSRRERLVLKPLRLEQLVAELVIALRPMLPETIDIVVTQGQDLLPVAADASAVQQMVLNLATNASDAMPAGGRLTIDVELATPADERMAAQAWGAPGYYVVLTVSDNGSGMDADLLDRIFEPYFSTKSPDQGSGLGLAMVYGLMKQHLGYVLVSSKPGTGSDVRLYFPVTAEAVPAAPSEVRQAAPRGHQTILVVEDQESVRSAMVRALTRFGYRVLSAADGEEGLQLWRANAATIDLIISDAIMPRMGGLALFEAVNRECPGSRFLLTSGYTGEEVRKSAPVVVDLSFLPKPWTVSELLTAVRRMLELREPRGSSLPAATGRII